MGAYFFLPTTPLALLLFADLFLLVQSGRLRLATDVDIVAVDPHVVGRQIHARWRRKAAPAPDVKPGLMQRTFDLAVFDKAPRQQSEFMRAHVSNREHHAVQPVE